MERHKHAIKSSQYAHTKMISYDGRTNFQYSSMQCRWFNSRINITSKLDNFYSKKLM